jgi:hypothetical protein
MERGGNQYGNAMTRISLSIVAAAAVLSFTASSSHAQQSGNAPWCAVLNMGDGDVVWECEYNTVEECVPNVLAGNRGFCELNPYGGHAAANVVPPARRKHHPRRQPSPS